MHIGTWAAWKRWAREGRAGWIGLGVALVCCAFAVLSGTAVAYRWTGMFLQVAGTLTVIVNVSKALEQFERPGIWSSLAAYLGRIPFVRRSITLSANGIASGASVGTAELISVHQPRDETIEELRRAVYANIAELNARITAVRSDLQKTQAQVKADLEEERNQRRAAVQRLEGELARSATDNRVLIVVGACWLILGIVLATATDELVRWFAGMAV